MTTEKVDSYFAQKARAVMTRADGDPAAAGPLTVWAQAAHADPTYDVGHQVVVGRDGAILAEARQSTTGRRSYTAYVTSVRDDADRDLIGDRAAAAVAALGRRHCGAILVTYSEVCTGPGHSRVDRHAKLLAEVRAATDAREQARVRQLAAIDAAKAERVPVEDIAVAAGYKTRDGLKQALRRRAAAAGE